MKKRGRKRKISYQEVIAYSETHPELFQEQIAKAFNISQYSVSHILRTTGTTHRTKQTGKPLKRRHRHTEETTKWEAILHNCGLGMERGMRINNHKIIYGWLENAPESKD